MEIHAGARCQAQLRSPGPLRWLGQMQTAVTPRGRVCVPETRTKSWSGGEAWRAGGKGVVMSLAAKIRDGFLEEAHSAEPQWKRILAQKRQSWENDVPDRGQE